MNSNISNIVNFTAPRTTEKSTLERFGLGSLRNELPVYASSPVHFKLGDDAEILTKCSDRKVIYNTRNDQVINVVKSSYNIDYQPIDGVDIIEKMFVGSGLDCTGMTRTYEQSHEGARYAVIYTLPAHTIDLGNGDVSELTLTHRNSGDGSWCFTLEVGWNRIVCMNRQVSIDYFSLFKTKHTPNMSPEYGARKIAAVLQGFEAEKERWVAWKNQSITNMEAFKIFAAAAKFKIDTQLSLHELLVSTSYRKSKAMQYMWNRYTTEEVVALGSNEWAAYNAMTGWATHCGASTAPSKKNLVSTKVDRANSVRSACTLLKAA
jgi:hypothetical protein